MSIRVTVEGEDHGVVLNVPMRIQHRRGRKHIVVPEGLTPEATIPAQPQEAVLIALARAHVWKEGLDSGRFPSIQHIADTLGVDGSYVGRLLRLTLLPPWEQEKLLGESCISDRNLEHVLHTKALVWGCRESEFREGIASSDCERELRDSLLQQTQRVRHDQQ